MASNSAITSFESQLQSALKEAAINAAASLFTSSPEMTLEDFYAVMRPQGVTETIKLGELAGALSGSPVAYTSVIKPAASTFSVEHTGNVQPKPKKMRVVNCRTVEGQLEYERAILSYLEWSGDWVSGPEIMKNVGGTKSQMSTTLRNYLVPKGHAVRIGETYGTRYKIGSGKKSMRRRKAGKEAENGQVDSRTKSGREAYRATILRFMRGKKWLSGPEISEACGGNENQRKRMVGNLISEGIVEHNGKFANARRFRRTK